MLQRVSRSLNIFKHYKFSTYNNNSNYPYVFGGLKSAQDIFHDQQQMKRKSVVGQIWGQSIFDQFVTAYSAYLQGLRDKDKQFLQQIMEKQLTREIQFPQTNLLNPESQVAVAIGRQTIVIGGNFDRSLHIHQWKPYLGSEDNSKQNFRVYATNLSSTTPVLYSVQIYFKSKKKLEKVQNGDKQKQQTQIHMLQMQIQNKKYNIFSIYPLIAKQLFKSLFDSSRSASNQVLKKILDVEKAQWRIADADKVLNGNFPQIKDK